ncbi:DNA-binding transcriptional regulator, MarR family [Sinosporangium album]|uniref:DNA-binding transcriptional regulator, MarR family n=1 Tax=Sinosporangium album TaxID=504805 RepID=A0A1G7YY29_9ACTN|nr:MarR family winged helix-turn-helix transcriptional regulator [Sinosporangium album]SDH01324.1 DNA-binding transcriptional regulator, MarR family [Sinosporangium album]
MTTTTRAEAGTMSEQTGFAEALMGLTRLVQHVFADVSREHHVTPQQAQLLCRLLPGPVGVTELGRLLNLEKSSVSGLVDRVERRGLVVRVRDSRDRRTCRIALTPEGVKLANDSHEKLTERLETLAGPLSQEAKLGLTEVATQLIARYEDSR